METQKNKNLTAKRTGSGFAIGGSIIAAICIAIYLFALVQGALRIYLSIDQRKITAEQEFAQIADIAVSAGTQGFMDEKFIQTMNNALLSSSSIEALIITGAEIGYAFEKQAGYAITWVNYQPRFVVNKFGLSNQDLYRPLAINDVRNANIKAIAGTFDYNRITGILKETLIIILIGFALAFFTMLIQLLVKKPVKNETEYEEAPEPKKKTKSRNSNKITDDPLATGIIAENIYKNEPKEHNSPRNKIRREENLSDRLSVELNRCASDKKDLTLIIAEFTDLADDKTYRAAAEEAANFFSSGKLLFEYGDSGFAAVLPEIDLDTGITKSEKFYQRMTSAEESPFKMYIGLSSRSDRLLNADRLMLEAGEALKRAKSDPDTAIIAFRSDPEKYREYIRRNSQS